MRGHILVIDDEKYVYEDLEFGLGKAHEIHYASKLARINSIMKNFPIDLAIVDLDFNPEIKEKEKKRFAGLSYIKKLRDKNPTITIAVLSGYSEVDKIVTAVKNGADHYLLKGNLDTDSDEFREQVRQWINAKKKLDQKRKLDSQNAWGINTIPENVLKKCREFNSQMKSYILLAEPGLGQKHLLEKSYLNSTLFKPDKRPQEIDLSSYSGSKLLNYIQLTRGETKKNFLKHPIVKIQYLRNIEKHSLQVQEAFLQLIQKGMFVNTREPLNLQLVFLIEKDPYKLIEEKALSPEFYNYLPKVEIKPLRENGEEINNFISQWKKRNDYSKLTFSKDAIILIRRYPYPGNISELYAILGKIITNHKKQFPMNWEEKPVQTQSLPLVLLQTSSVSHEDMHYEVAKIQLTYLEAALKKYEGERSQKNLAAEELKINSADNLKKTIVNKYWDKYPELMKGFPTIMEKYKLE